MIAQLEPKNDWPMTGELVKFGFSNKEAVLYDREGRRLVTLCWPKGMEQPDYMGVRTHMGAEADSMSMQVLEYMRRAWILLNSPLEPRE